MRVPKEREVERRREVCEWRKTTSRSLELVLVLSVVNQETV